MGGKASRAEVYALFVAAVIVIGGGVGGAVVLSSDEQPPSASVAGAEVEDRLASEKAGGAAKEDAGSSTSGRDQVNSAAPPNRTSPAPSSGQVEPRPTVSISGLSEEESQIVQELVARETEAQRQERLERERQEFRAANPAGRFNGSAILACTPVTTGSETIQLVEYRIDYEAFQPLSRDSYVNPGLSIYQGSAQQLRAAAASGWRTQPERLNIALGVGRHSVVLHGLLFPSGGPPYVEVRLQAVDSATYSDLAIDLPLPNPVCG